MTVQHERGGKLACATISYPHLLCSGSTAAHMPAICDLFLAADPPLAATPVSDNNYFWEHNWGTPITNQGKKRLKSDKMGLLSTKARSGKYYL